MPVFLRAPDDAILLRDYFFFMRITYFATLLSSRRRVAVLGKESRHAHGAIHE